MAFLKARAFFVLAILTFCGCKSEPGKGVEGRERGDAAPLAKRSGEAGAPEAGGLSLTAAMPDDFPKAIPVYPGSRVTLGGRQEIHAGKSAWSLTSETADAQDAVLAFYGAHLPGFAPTSRVSLGDSFLAVWHGEAYDLDLVLGKGADGTTTVTLDVAER